MLLARGSDGKLSCPTHRRARDPQGCPWLYKQSANGESSDPSEWIPDKHELASNTFKCTRDGKDREVSARAVFTKQPDTIKDRRADEISVEEKCQRQARDPLELQSHCLEWMTIDRVLDTESDDWVDEAQGTRVKMMAYQGLAAIGRNQLPKSDSQFNGLIKKWDGSFLTHEVKWAEQYQAVVSLKTCVRKDTLTAVPAELRDGYGRELSEGLSIGPEGNRRELCGNQELVQQGLIIPNGVLTEGTQYLKMHVRNMNTKAQSPGARTDAGFRGRHSDHARQGSDTSVAGKIQDGNQEACR